MQLEMIKESHKKAELPEQPLFGITFFSWSEPELLELCQVREEEILVEYGAKPVIGFGTSKSGVRTSPTGKLYQTMWWGPAKTVGDAFRHSILAAES